MAFHDGSLVGIHLAAIPCKHQCRQDIIMQLVHATQPSSLLVLFRQLGSTALPGIALLILTRFQINKKSPDGISVSPSATPCSIRHRRCSEGADSTSPSGAGGLSSLPIKVRCPSASKRGSLGQSSVIVTIIMVSVKNAYNC